MTVPPFDFATATEISFGRGRIRELPTRACSFGTRALVVTGSSQERFRSILDTLEGSGITTTTLAVSGEPSTDVAKEGVERARQGGSDMVIGMGGGSALDAAKAIAALVANDGDPLDYLEVVGKGRALTRPSLPCIAAPTTAGTGSEVTRNAVLASPEHRVKVSLRSIHMLPRLAIVDPELTDSVPPAVTAATGLDALTQVIEPYVSIAASPLVDGLCLEAISRGSRALRRAYRDGRDAAARDDMAFTSLCGGLALANAKLGAVHGFAGPIGGMFDAPHGALCALLLPIVMSVNLRALRERNLESAAIARYGRIAQIVTGDPHAGPDDGPPWFASLVSDLCIPALRHYGVSSNDLDRIVEKATVASSMKGNPIVLERNELAEIVERAMDGGGA